MANRGRGLLEVQKSSNPFFQTANGEYGVNIAQQVAYRDKFNLIPGDKSSFKDSEKKYADDEDFSFLYQRTSEKIGSTVPKPERTREYSISKADLAKRRRETIRLLETILPQNNKTEPVKPTADDVSRTLKSWKQGNQIQNNRNDEIHNFLMDD